MWAGAKLRLAGAEASSTFESRARIKSVGRKVSGNDEICKVFEGHVVEGCSVVVSRVVQSFRVEVESQAQGRKTRIAAFLHSRGISNIRKVPGDR
jgi:hypothetical protein